MQIIDAAMARSRTVILGLITVLVAGVTAYLTIPKEAEPDIEIPLIYVYIEHSGISPEDAERLLVRPMEQEIRVVEGIKEMMEEGDIEDTKEGIKENMRQIKKIADQVLGVL